MIFEKNKCQSANIRQTILILIKEDTFLCHNNKHQVTKEQQIQVKHKRPISFHINPFNNNGHDWKIKLLNNKTMTK